MTTSAPPTAASRLAAPVYFVAALLVVLPAADFMASVWPFHPGDHRWRFGMVGLLAGFLLTPLLGLVLASAAAAVAGHRTAQRAIGLFSLVGTGVLVALLALFALDLLQVRPSLQPEALGNFDFANIRSVVKHLLGAAALGWLGMANIRGASAAVATAGARRPDKRAAVLAPSAAAPRG